MFTVFRYFESETVVYLKL